MHSFLKPNNLIAILIAAVLISVGSALFYVNNQRTSQAETNSGKVQSSSTANSQTVEELEDGYIEVSRSSQNTLSKVAMIHEDHNAPETDSAAKTELEIIRDAIDWSDAPLPAPELVKTDDYDVYINVTKEYLVYVFDKMGYTGEKIDSGETAAIPPLIVVTINKGWADAETVQFKKSVFYRVILSLILYENEAVLRERANVLAILDDRAEGGGFSTQQMDALTKIAHSYRVIAKQSQDPLTEDQIQELLIRVDAVPPSLALAQAAHESGYATSRFAYTANALFGQWDWSADAVKPQQQRKGMGNYGIRRFDQPIDSVRAYIWNLNTHRAYAGFRKERSTQRGEQRGLPILDSQKLADTLTSYSERGAEYTEELKGTIRINRLERADHLRLMQGEPIYFN